MKTRIYLSILILCATLQQGVGKLLEKNSKKSSDIHVRKKRVINRIPNENQPTEIQHVPYIVNILKNGESDCAGSILHPLIIATAAHCVDSNAIYTILSGSSNVRRGTPHNVTHIIIHPHYHPHVFSDDLALVYIWPPIDFETSPNKIITLYNNGHGYSLPSNTEATVSGWGVHHLSDEEMKFPKHVRSTTVHTISVEYCAHIYRFHHPVTERDICTYDPRGDKCCGEGDSGGPLVVHGHLVGIFSWSSGLGGPVFPDVFVNLLHPVYSNWIHSHVPHYP